MGEPEQPLDFEYTNSMNWLGFAILTAIFYSLFDFFVKLTSDKMHPLLGGFIINFVSAVILLVLVIVAKFNGDKVFAIKPNGIFYSVLAGIAIGLVTVTFFKMFATGTNLSTGSLIVRVGTVVLATILGVVLLKESVNLKYILGFLVSMVGLYLVMTAR